MKSEDSSNFIKALETGNRELMRKVPRADVHNHAALSGDFDRWAAKEGLDLKDKLASEWGIQPQGKDRRFSDFTDFQKLVDTIFTYPWSPPSNEQQQQRFLSLFAAAYELAISDGVTCIEPGYDAVLLDYYEMDLEKMISDFKKQTDFYSEKLTIMPDIGIIRVFDKKDLERTIYPCIVSGFFMALDIFADERMGPPEDFTDIYRAAKKAGMKLKAHAGELLGADFVRRSVEVLELDEVQHGIAAAKSPEVMRFLADNDIRLNVCPSSNIQLCQADSYETHPLRILMDNGVRVTVNTDDVIIFGQKSSDEFFNLYETGLYSPEELDEVRLNGFPAEG